MLPAARRAAEARGDVERAQWLLRRSSSRRRAHAAITSSRGIAAASFTLGSTAGEIARHERDFGVRLGARRVVGGDRVAAAVVHQQPRGLNFGTLAERLGRRHREVRRRRACTGVRAPFRGRRARVVAA